MMKLKRKNTRLYAILLQEIKCIILKSDSEVEACKEQVKEVLSKWKFKKIIIKKLVMVKWEEKIEALPNNDRIRNRLC